MEKKRTIQRTSNKKRGRPRVRFNIGVILVIFALSFIGCFAMYMISANIKGDFLDEEQTTVSVEAGSAEGTTAEAAVQQSNRITYPVPQSPAADASYFKDCCLITDSTLLAMASSPDFMEVIGNAQLNAASCCTTPVSGTSTVIETVKSRSPKNIYIMLGCDLGVSTSDNMIKGVGGLVSELKTSCPEAKIYVMQLPPIAKDTETVSSVLVNSYNDSLMQTAKELGIYCIDTNTPFKSAAGTLAAEYSDPSGALSEKALDEIRSYILTHTA